MKKILLAIICLTLFISTAAIAGPMEDYGKKADEEKCPYIGTSLEEVMKDGWTIETEAEKVESKGNALVTLKKGDEELVLLLKNDSEQEIDLGKGIVVDSIDDITFVYEGIVVKMHYDSVPVVEQLTELLGEPVSYTEEPSCAFKGVDKCYEYPDFIMITYPTPEGIDRIKTVVFMSDALTTNKGIALGDDAAKVAEAYGEDLLQGNAYLIRGEGQQLVIAMDNDKVNMIQYVGILGY